jgi:hypothetical protein
LAVAAQVPLLVQTAQTADLLVGTVLLQQVAVAAEADTHHVLEQVEKAAQAAHLAIIKAVAVAARVAGVAILLPIKTIIIDRV